MTDQPTPPTTEELNATHIAAVRDRLSAEHDHANGLALVERTRARLDRVRRDETLAAQALMERLTEEAVANPDEPIPFVPVELDARATAVAIYGEFAVRDAEAEQVAE